MKAYLHSKNIRPDGGLDSFHTFSVDAKESPLWWQDIKAKSERGAVCALSRRSGISWRAVGCERYDSKSGATCAFIREYDPEYNNGYSRLETDDRGKR